jgi:hypothetical protein|nr:MAG TPA: hypothetical protein [Caudoviricetes sp.]
MLLYLRTSKGDISTQNTGDRAYKVVNGTEHFTWAFPNSLEPYEIRRSQSEFLGSDTGDMLLAVKRVDKNSNITEMHIGIDGSFYQRYGQRVLDVSDINSIIASAVAKVASTYPFPVGYGYLTNEEKPTLPSFGTFEVKYYGKAIGVTEHTALGGMQNTGPIYKVTRTA